MSGLTEKEFIDWESHVFGFGYGTGEEHTLKALKDFFRCIPMSGTYDYSILENKLGSQVAWLLINILCHCDVIEYGSSPRFGWLTEKGKLLQDFFHIHSENYLYNLTNTDENYHHCYPDYCNCDLEKCSNRLF